MKKNRILKILFSLVFFPGIALAAICGYYGFGGSKSLLEGVNTSELSGLVQLVINLTDFITGCLVLPALVLVIVASGVFMMISLGDPARIDRGKRTLFAGLIGLIIIFAAKGFIDYWQKKLGF
jgi:hypothetical protein